MKKWARKRLRLFEAKNSSNLKLEISRKSPIFRRNGNFKLKFSMFFEQKSRLWVGVRKPLFWQNLTQIWSKNETNFSQIFGKNGADFPRESLTQIWIGGHKLENIFDIISESESPILPEIISKIISNAVGSQWKSQVKVWSKMARRSVIGPFLSFKLVFALFSHSVLPIFGAKKGAYKAIWLYQKHPFDPNSLLT